MFCFCPSPCTYMMERKDNDDIRTNNLPFEWHPAQSDSAVGNKCLLSKALLVKHV